MNIRQIESLRLDYPLNENSIVWSIGGYVGNWSDAVISKFNCNVWIFEPISQFFGTLESKYKNNPKVKLFNFGLWSGNTEMKINIDNDSSSLFSCGSNLETIQLIDVVEFMNKENIDSIDLVDMNVEGAEYELLPLLIDSGCIIKMKNLQIQFHRNVSNYECKRTEIQNRLKETHNLMWNEDYVWESWALK